MYESFISSDFGRIRIIWTQNSGFWKITSVKFTEKDSDGQKARIKDLFGKRIFDDVACKLEKFLNGRKVYFDLELLDMRSCSEFRRKVLTVENETPRGFVTTYGCIARNIGMPGRARAVGKALGDNPFPLIIPCHRTVKSDGSPGGYQGGREMKRRLLEMEGVGFDPKGRVVLKEFMYDFTSNRKYH